MLPWSAAERCGVKPHLLAKNPPAEARRRGCVFKNQLQKSIGKYDLCEAEAGTRQGLAARDPRDDRMGALARD